MSYSIDTYLGDVNTALQNNNLDNALNVNVLTATHMPLLQPLLQGVTANNMMNKIESYQYCNGNWPSFETLLQNYLLFVRDVNPWSILDTIDPMIRYFESLSVALNNLQFNSKLLPVVYSATRIVVPLAKLVDEKMMKVNKRVNDYPRLSHISSILLKALNNLRSDPDLNTPSNRYKISTIMFISVTLCKSYNSIGSPYLCNNVFSNINILNLDNRLVSRKQLIQYRFLLGKFHFSQSNYYLAYLHLNWCYINCHNKTSSVILTTILKYLVPCGLLVGKVPELRYLYQKFGYTELIQRYEPLIKFYKNGDLYSFTRTVYQNEDYFIQLGILVGLLQRCRVIILRNLLFKVYKLTRGLVYNQVKTCLNLSLNPTGAFMDFDSNYRWFYLICLNGNANGPLEFDDMFYENVLVTVIDSNLIKAKLTVTKTMIMSKSATFPRVFDIYSVKYLKNDKEKWLD